MKIRLLLATLVTSLALGAGLYAQEKKEDQTELGAKMEKIGGAWRAIKRQITDASKNDDTLARLAVVKENMTAALKLEPELTKEKPAAERAKFVADYQAKLKEEITKLDKIIAAVKAGKNAEAGELIGVVDQDQKDAHKAFKKGKKKQ
jgi:hypothetical protein